ncbi:hypothetical protein Sango_0813800 [Sesamum angolense]|uniref:Reverse transcriptase Ty1/copia-type domain-containing protein n=1 Tax=Sesamum angolense TaxID=2727404 RepID=A0AAE1X338_9LAMI|nr:hypothetical protein Sango_0813800 [Sesamum angolense]
MRSQMNLDGVRERVVNDFESDFVTYNIKDNPNVGANRSSFRMHHYWVCKWIFKKKLKPDGIVEKFKARLVAKSFKQNERIDYFDTYSLVARFTIIRVLIALALVYNLPIHQMNVKTTFCMVNSRKKYAQISLRDL